MLTPKRVLVLATIGAVLGVILLAIQERPAGGQDRGETTVTASPEETTTTTTVRPVPVPMPIFRPQPPPFSVAQCVKPMVRLIYPDLCKAELIPPLVIERELPAPEPVPAVPSFTG